MEITSGLAKKFGVREGYGLMISKVYEKSAARKGGLAEGDVMVLGNGSPIRTLNDIRGVLNGLTTGESVKITFYRDGKRKSAKLLPDMVSDGIVEWDEFLSRSNIFSRYIGDSILMRRSNILNRRLAQVKGELKRLKNSHGGISKEQLERIHREITFLKNKLEDTITKELKHLQDQKQLIDEEVRRFREEEKRIIKEVDKIKNRIEKDKNTDSTVV